MSQSTDTMAPPITSIVPRPRRRPVNKTFSGCAKCKARKIKCDETKPSCTQCKAKGITCPGFPSQPRLRWSRKHEILEPTKFVSSDPILPFSNSAQVKPVSEISPPETIGSGAADGDCDWVTWTESAKSKETVMASPDQNADGTTPSTNDTESSPCLDISFCNPGPLPVDWDKEIWDTLLSLDENQYFPYGEISSDSVPSNSSPESSHRLQFEDSLDEATQVNMQLPEAELEPLDPKRMEISSPTRSDVAVYDFQTKKGAKEMEGIQVSWSPQLLDLPRELVAIYFSVVCPILSTFDSEHNAFRSFVSLRWQNSLLVFQTIQSMAAAKLSWRMPEMKSQALEYRSLALNTLYSELSRNSCWNSELLFIVIMLGISSCWYDITDLGIVHLEAVQQAILHNKVNYSDGFHDKGFFRDALIYWEMVSCIVSDKVTYHDYSKVDSPQPEPTKHRKQSITKRSSRIRPHPWTGVASEPQALFTSIIQQVRRLYPVLTSKTSKLSLDLPNDFLDEVKSLEEAMWAYHLPSLHDIISVGDENTPAIHHLLLAEAYMFANFYHLYSTFSNLRRKRVKWLKTTVDSNSFDRTSWAENQMRSWASILREDDGTEKWLRFLGRSIIIRLEQIQTTSGTSCVQALLLLVASTSLSTSSPLSDAEDDDDNEEEAEILQARQFVLNRLTFLAESNLSAPIYHVKSVVMEIFKRLDIGVDVYWMDVLQSMGVLTIIG